MKYYVLCEYPKFVAAAGLQPAAGEDFATKWKKERTIADLRTSWNDRHFYENTAVYNFKTAARFLEVKPTEEIYCSSPNDGHTANGSANSRTFLVASFSDKVQRDLFADKLCKLSNDQTLSRFLFSEENSTDDLHSLPVIQGIGLNGHARRFVLSR